MSEVQEKDDQLIEEVDDNLDEKLEAIMGASEEDASQDEETQHEDDSQEDETWVTSEVLSEAESYGLNERDLEEFGSVDEFQRAGRLLDEQAMQLQKEPEVEEEEEEEEFVPPIDIEKMKEEDFEEYSIKMGEETNASAEYRFNQKRQQASEAKEKAEREYDRRANAFHDELNKLDPKFYGKTRDDDGNPIQISRTEDSRRQRIHETMEVMAKMNPNAKANSAMFARADRLAFSGSREERLKSAKSQSRTRRTTGRTSTTKTTKRGTPDEVSDSPEAQAIFARHKRENGE